MDQTGPLQPKRVTSHYWAAAGFAGQSNWRGSLNGPDPGFAVPLREGCGDQSRTQPGARLAGPSYRKRFVRTLNVHIETARHSWRIPRERGGGKVPFTDEQLTEMRGGLTAEEYRAYIIRKFGM